MAKEPLGRCAPFFWAKGFLVKRHGKHRCKDNCAEEVESAVEAYLSAPAPACDGMFEHLYAVPSARALKDN